VEMLVEQNVIAEMRIGLKFLSAAKHRAPAMFISQSQWDIQPGNHLRSNDGTAAAIQ
jgi:hypothetical protein